MEAQAHHMQRQQVEQDQQQQDPDTGWSSDEFMDAWEDDSDDQDEGLVADDESDAGRDHLLEAAAAEPQQDQPAQHADLLAAQDVQQQGQEAAADQEDGEAQEMLDNLQQLDPDDRTRVLYRLLRRLRRQAQADTAAADRPVMGTDAAGGAHAGSSSEVSSSAGSMSDDAADESDGAEQDRAGALLFASVDWGRCGGSSLGNAAAMAWTFCVEQKMYRCGDSRMGNAAGWTT